ncbi:hypothetical protein ZIOFF_069685 [Zingiber officinale]|uniref:Uncharacterized protein n=1 Tax=Zingiber officinale TaxID=94328 RepID=A0A8J5CW34_ZINOF|nr:hypothetical protein ZIOFF_069685 [Zingiber officinale]
MTNRARPNITEVITEADHPTVSSQEDQIRSYRRMTRLRYEAQRRHSGRRSNTRTLESQLNPEAELELSQQRRASLVPAETLYSTHWSEPRHRVYQHYSETRILVTEGQRNLPLINPESYSILRREVLRDTRWSDDRSVIGAMEIDLSKCTQFVYIAPNLLISIDDFIHHIELAIQTHGYENWNSAENYLASTRINAVPTTPRTTTELQGMRWILQPPLISQIRNPQAIRTTTLMDGSISLAITGYQSTGNPKPSKFNEKDIEDINDEEFAGVFISFQEEYGLPDTNDRWDTLGEPSGKYNYYVNYAAPPTAPFIPATKPSWGDEEDNDCEDIEVVLPSIWEDTPWEEDPNLDPNDLAPNTEEYEDEEDGPETYFLGLQDQETDYPHVEQIEAQLQPPLSNGWYTPEQNMIIEEFLDRIPQGMPEGIWYEVYEMDPEQQEDQQNMVSDTSQLTDDITNLTIHQELEEQEVAHVNTEQLMEQLEYPMLRKLIQSTSKEKAFASTSDSAISNYKQPNEPLMGQINYPPAEETTPQFPDNGPYKGKFKGRAMDHQTWTIPSTQQTTGAMLVLPKDIGFWFQNSADKLYVWVLTNEYYKVFQLVYRERIRQAPKGSMLHIVSHVNSELELNINRAQPEVEEKTVLEQELDVELKEATTGLGCEVEDPNIHLLRVEEIMEDSRWLSSPNSFKSVYPTPPPTLAVQSTRLLELNSPDSFRSIYPTPWVQLPGLLQIGLPDSLDSAPPTPSCQSTQLLPRHFQFNLPDSWGSTPPTASDAAIVAEDGGGLDLMAIDVAQKMGVDVSLPRPPLFSWAQPLPRPRLDHARPRDLAARRDLAAGGRCATSAEGEREDGIEETVE